MKLKRRRAVEVPPNIKSFIDSVTATLLENVELPLKDFAWEFDKGDIHHWVDLFNHFDSFFESYIKPRKDLQLEDNFLDVDPPFPREAVLQILRVSRVILENCMNRHLYSFFEHLSALLASTDADIVEASLQALMAFVNKSVGKSSIRSTSLTSKLFAFSQGWGGKEGGLGLIVCSLPSGSDPVSTEIGSTLHFEFYCGADISEKSQSLDKEHRLEVIHLSNVNTYKETDLEILDKLVKDYCVPTALRFPLLTRLRFARAFESLTCRRQYICIRLYAFIVLVQAGHDSECLSSFLNNEPEFIDELLSLLSYEDEIPEKIRILGILSLVALCQDRSHQPTVLSSVTSGGHRGMLPSLMQKAVDSIISGSMKWSIIFAEALLSLVSMLVSSTPGSLALQEAGFIPTILPLLKDTNTHHLHLVSTAVHVIESFLDYHNPSSALFRDLGGLDDTIERLKVEILQVEIDLKKSEESQSVNKGKEVESCSPVPDVQPLCSEALILLNRKNLMKVLLRTISLATYVPGNSARVDGSEENVLPTCLCTIFRRGKDFGGGVFSLAANVMSDLIHKDPTCYTVLDAAGLPQAFLDAIMGGVLYNSDVVSCIPQCLDAICLNNSGLQLVKDCNALRCFVTIFTSRSYLKALSGDTTGALSSGLDELMRHASSLRSSGVDVFIEILNNISKVGCDGDPSCCVESDKSSAAVHMDTDVEEMTSQTEGVTSEVESSGKLVDAPLDVTQSSSIESFLPECICNVARLLETVLQNTDTCRLFIEKKGIEAVLQLFKLPSMPVSVSIGQSISVAFKNFSPQHSVSLARAVCSFFRDHLKLTNEQLGSMFGTKLVDSEPAKQSALLKSLSTLEGLLSLSNFLLKGTTIMVSELAFADADILKELGKVYIEVAWQISLLSNSKVDKKDEDQDDVPRDASISNASERDSDDDMNAATVARYMNPVSVRSSLSPWSMDQDFLSAVRSAANLHRHGRHSLSRIRGRLSAALDATHTDMGDLFSPAESSRSHDNLRKSPDVVVSELLTKLGYTMRSFLYTLVKGLPARRRADSNLSPASRSLVTALAQLFLCALGYSGHSTAGFEMSLSVKCRYLGKVVEDMAVLTLDSRRRSCSSALVNSFYVNGTFKEVLTTFEATSQLLWTLPFSIPATGTDHVSSISDKVSHSSWLLDTLQSYCKLLDYYVNSTFLLSPSSSHNQLLVQPIVTELSINLFPVPSEPESFVHMLQSQVLEAVLPVWNHTMFPECSPALIASLVSIMNHICSGVGDLKQSRSNVGAANQRVTSPPLDESAVATIVEMGFSRARAEEALRNVRTNSVEMATDWLFSHPEEFVQEDVQLAQALALSLGSSVDAPKEDGSNKNDAAIEKEKGVVILPLDNILTVSTKLFCSGDSMAFPLTDLLVTLCNRNKGENRQWVVLYLFEQLKRFPSDSSADTGTLYSIAHLLALLLSEDSGIRELGAANGVIPHVLDILENIKSKTDQADETWNSVSALLLIMDNMLQFNPKLSVETPEGTSKSASDASSADSKVNPVPTAEKKTEIMDSANDASANVFEKILGKSTGYLTNQESQKTLTLCCEFIKQHVPAIVMQAVLQLCARLTKTHALAAHFFENGGLASLLNLPRRCIFPGFETLASAIVRHLIEDPQTLQSAMELEIRQSLSNHGSRTPRSFLTNMAPVISRDPVIFMRAVTSVCQLDSSGGRMNVVLLKDKEKDREKQRVSSTESGAQCNEPVRLTADIKSVDTPNRCSRSHKKVRASLSQVIDQLLEIIMSYPSANKEQGFHGSSLAPMDIDEPNTKGKTKVVDRQEHDGSALSERSAMLLKLAFVLKLMSEILLMYVHAVGIILRRDTEISQSRSCDQGAGHSGLLHHIFHLLLPLSSSKTADRSDDWLGKLSERASWFLVALCCRSAEGRRRVISEIVKAFCYFIDSASSTSKGSLIPDKKVLAFSELVNSILSRNSQSNLPVLGCSPDIAKPMIDGRIVQSLSGLLKVIDLDHPDAPKVVNLILKALDSLTRTAYASDQVLMSDRYNKNRLPGSHERTHEADETVIHEQSTDTRHHHTDDTIQCTRQQAQELSNFDGHNITDHDQPIEQEVGVDLAENTSGGNRPMNGMEFMREETIEGNVMATSTDVGLAFPVHQADDEMGEDNEDLGEEGEDEEDEDEDDEEIADEGAGLMSIADTDIEDQENTAIGDEYNDDLMDEEDDDFLENRVIEVRWRESLTGMDHHLRFSRGHADSNGFIDISSESFQGVGTDDSFDLHRPFGLEHRRQSGGRSFLDRTRSDGNAFLHPLLVRPAQSREGTGSAWPSGGTSRDLHTLSFGSSDIPLYMLDAGFPPETAPPVFGERAVSTAPPPLIDFSLGMDSLRIRRGPGENLWTDDGQPQAGNHAAAVAQAVEDQFVSQLTVASNSNNAPQMQPEQMGNDVNPQLPSPGTDKAELIAADSPAEPLGSHQQIRTVNQEPAPSNDGLCPANVQVNQQSVDAVHDNHVEEATQQTTGDDPSAIVPSDEIISIADRQLGGRPERVSLSGNQSYDRIMHNEIEVPQQVQSSNDPMEAPSDLESSCHALLTSTSAAPELSDAHVDSTTVNADVDMNNIDIPENEVGNLASGSDGNDLSSRRDEEALQEPIQTEQANANNEASSANEIDPTFLEALPEDLRAEVLASQQNRSAPTASYTPPAAEEIDPEFLAALPAEIQAEVLAQQRAQRIAHSQSIGQPVDMDNASIIATFPPDLREEVLLTSSEAVLSALPSALLAEAQMLRDRELTRYRARGSLFGGSYRLGGRRLPADNQTVIDRAVGVTVGRRVISATPGSSKGKDVEGTPLLDSDALRALIRLLQLATPLSKGLLQRLLFNLCAHSVTRITLVGHLLDMIKPESEGLSRSDCMATYRLHGCQWNIVYAQSHCANGLPPLVTRRLLEILTYLASNHPSVADLLVHFSPSASSNCLTLQHSKEASQEIPSSEGYTPILLFLKLLNKPLFLRSRVYLEQVMCLLEVIVNNAASKVDYPPRSAQFANSSDVELVNGAASQAQVEPSTLEQVRVQDNNQSKDVEVPASGARQDANVHDILTELPDAELHNLCSILALEGLPDKVYSLAAEVVKKLASVAASHQKFFSIELAGIAQSLSSSAVEELVTLKNTQMLGLSTCSMAGASILRVLQVLSTLTSNVIDSRHEQDVGQEGQSILWDLNVGLEPLWQQLSDCISATEAKLVHSSTFTYPATLVDALEVGASSSTSPPLPPGTQHLLPFIESFFVLCEKLQTNQAVVQSDYYATDTEVKESAGSSSSQSLRAGGICNVTFIRVAEKHRRLLNVFIRQNPNLLEKSLSIMLKVPRLIDFDNKRAYFWSRIRQQHDQHLSAPLRINVRRAYVLEDSYNQLRLRRSQDLKGRMTVQFQGEEGIDAGGLTREWYQLLSRVIFDKGALLFTTVGNNATFQPNPNSVYQMEHLSYFKFVGRVVAKALFDGQLLDAHFTRSFYKHILGAKVTYHDIEAVDPDYYKNLKWMLENDVSDIPDLTFSMDPDEEKHILYEKTEVTDYELKPGGRNIRVTEETKQEYVDLVAEHILTTAIRPQINSFLEGFTELVPRELISLFNDKELELLISGLPEIDLDDLKANAEYIGYSAASPVIQWFWEVAKAFSKEDMARLLQFVTGTSKVPLEGFKALQGISGPQRFQIHKAYGAPDRLPSAHTCFNQLDLPEYTSKEQLEERLLLAIHEASEGFGFG
ncbi:E3 ubiquitin-protein ligase UPL1-like isoform X2 [Phragmites australis]|uniref:E3 ubiquitin-protein ligase UPL1-like isoform X2 n=1 Tax=Phragmites australis TaxID=29695 RepID=UPI002D77D4DC|nr:E3 ubiquitin-protein ligase UPL1-like isoform X2 [Phragmites australis]